MPEQNAYTIISRKDALSQGLKTYFTAKPCPKGHVTFKWCSNGGCDSCLRQRRKDTNKDYRIKNDQKIKAYAKKYGQDNLVTKIANNAKRRAAQLGATPPWSDLEQIKEIYRNCDRLNESRQEVHHVDHIVPLQHSLVCGLHVPANLQILTAFENMSKGNKFEIE